MKSKNAKRCRSDLTTIQRLLTKHRRVMLVQKSQREKSGHFSEVSIHSIVYSGVAYSMTRSTL